MVSGILKFKKKKIAYSTVSRGSPNDTLSNSGWETLVRTVINSVGRHFTSCS